LSSDSNAKAFIKEHYHILSPVREDFIEEITREIVSDKKYSLEKIIDYLQNKKVPPLEKSGGKEENIKWFFQRDETTAVREDLIMRLKEYGEKGINIIQYKKKTLGRDTMSYGERCGTILELVLHSGDHPIIIDQPEEHLDSKFIADRIVDIIRKQKINRQVIICTHNANIVVLGDSELITVLSVEAKGTCGFQGSLENPNIRGKIYDVLEGGPEAFKKREQKYGFR
jgi:predicted ATP-dependent endonuclease of OLD family